MLPIRYQRDPPLEGEMLTQIGVVIINAPVMQEDSQGGKSKAKLEHKSKSAYCDVITKPYFLIVVAKYASHYSVVPIHTRKSPCLSLNYPFSTTFWVVRHVPIVACAQDMSYGPLPPLPILEEQC